MTSIGESEHFEAGVKPDTTTAERPQARPRAASIRVNLARVLRWSDRLADLLVSAYDRLFNFDSRETADLYLQLGTDFATSGNTDAAVGALHKVLEMQPDNSRAWFSLGMAHIRQQAPGAAIEAFQKARRFGYDSFQLHYRLAEAFVEVGDYEQAVEELLGAAKQQPSHAEAFYRLGIVYDRLNRYEEAVAAFEKAIEVQPREPAYYQSLGFCLDSMGQHERAIHCL